MWSCSQCYRLFHLRCIQQWAVDGVKQQSILSPELFPNQQRLWSCPNCRSDYSQLQCPKVYRCFCGKLVRTCLPLLPFFKFVYRITHLLMLGSFPILVERYVAGSSSQSAVITVYLSVILVCCFKPLCLYYISYQVLVLLVQRPYRFHAIVVAVLIR